MPPRILNGCTESDLTGDFNRMNGFTLGDAIYIAQQWASSQPVSCMGGDFNGVNGFTLGDAIFVAQVWAGEATFVW